MKKNFNFRITASRAGQQQLRRSYLVALRFINIFSPHNRSQIRARAALAKQVFFLLFSYKLLLFGPGSLNNSLERAEDCLRRAAELFFSTDWLAGWLAPTKFNSHDLNSLGA